MPINIEKVESMEKIFSKTRILVWAVIALLALNIATIGTIVWHLKSFESSERDRFFHNRKMKNGFDGHIQRPNLIEKLKFNEAQNEEFKKLEKNYRDSAWYIAVQMHRVREEMFTSLSTDKADMKKVEIFADSIGQYHKQLKMKTARFYLQVRKICTPQQADSLENFFKRIIGQEPDVPFPPHFHV